MKYKSALRYLVCSAIGFGIFFLFTALVSVVDVRPAASSGLPVGFATVNECFFRSYGGIESLSYHVSEFLMGDRFSPFPALIHPAINGRGVDVCIAHRVSSVA